MLKPKAIVCDLDDCIFSFLQDFINYYNTVFEKEVCLPELTEYEFPAEVSAAFKGWERVGGYRGLSLEFGAYRFVELLHANDIKLIFMTARPEEYRIDTERALKKSRIYNYESLIFAKDKAAKINELKSEYEIIGFIDDKASTVNSVKENCNLPFNFLITKNHNKFEALNEGVIKIDTILCSWKILGVNCGR